LNFFCLMTRVYEGRDRVGFNMLAHYMTRPVSFWSDEADSVERYHLIVLYKHGR
jgi:hypothetical protein